MYGLSPREVRFALLISSTHFVQHTYYRILPPLIPVLAVALEYPLWQLGLLITFYSVSMGIAHAPLGILADRINRRYLLSVGIGLTGGAYVLFAFGMNLGTVIPTLAVRGHIFEGGYLVMSLAMMIVGIGLAVVHPAGYPMITDNVDFENKGKVLGLFGASSKLGDGATPAIIAGMILVLGWQEIILLFGIAGIIYGAALHIALRADEYDTVPAATRTSETADSAPTPFRDDHRGFLYPLVVIYLFFVTSDLTNRGLATFLPAFLVAVYAYSFEFMGLQIGSESVANLYFALLLFAGAGMQLVLGRMTDEYDPRNLLIGLMVLASLGMVALAVFHLSVISLILVIFILGTGLYGVNPPRDAIISDISPPEYEGRTFGYIFTAAILTGSIYPTVVGYVLEVFGMREGFLILVVGTLLATASVMLLYSERIYHQSGRGRVTMADDTGQST